MAVGALAVVLLTARPNNADRSISIGVFNAPKASSLHPPINQTIEAVKVYLHKPN